MHTRRSITLAIACAFAAPATLRAAPVVVEGRRFDDHVLLFGRDLVLNGTGLRAVAWFKGYAAGLYLPAVARTAPAVLAMPGPKRLQMQMLQDVPAAEFTRAFDKGVARNTTAGELPALLARMQQFERQIGAVGKVRLGDVVDLDLDPGQGMTFSLNGRPRAEPIAGADFYAALLRSFIGERPYDDALRAGLLGAPV